MDFLVVSDLPWNYERELQTRAELNVQFVSNNCSVGFRCGLLVATRVPQVLQKIETQKVRIL
jgi:hypothetical protein